MKTSENRLRLSYQYTYHKIDIRDDKTEHQMIYCTIKPFNYILILIKLSKNSPALHNASLNGY